MNKDQITLYVFYFYKIYLNEPKVMQTSNKEPFLNFPQKSLLILFFVVIISSLLAFKNLFYQPIFLLKSFGELSIKPEIAFTNEKPTFVEFYAEWCEVCKDMAPKVAAIRDEYAKDINFVFLNVDNPKWDVYIRKFNVNGIPQVNLFDSQAKLGNTFIGKQEEKTLRTSLENLKNNLPTETKMSNSNFSSIERSKNFESSPRSHG